MRVRLLVVMKITSQSPPQRRLVPHDDVIQALAANRDPISRSTYGFCSEYQRFTLFLIPRTVAVICRARSARHAQTPTDSLVPLALQQLGWCLSEMPAPAEQAEKSGNHKLGCRQGWSVSKLFDNPRAAGECQLSPISTVSSHTIADGSGTCDVCMDVKL
jgi:hypothetical protein